MSLVLIYYLIIIDAFKKCKPENQEIEIINDINLTISTLSYIHCVGTKAVSRFERVNLTDEFEVGVLLLYDMHIA